VTPSRSADVPKGDPYVANRALKKFKDSYLSG